MNRCYNETSTAFEIGADEAGRGPLFGRVYSAAVILPKDDSFDHTQMKDSKKFHSSKKIKQVEEYIKANAIAWSVAYEDEKVIDEINILQATQQAMHKAIKDCMMQLCSAEKKALHETPFMLLIDGNYFNPITEYNKMTHKIEVVPHVCVEGGDNKYTSIAAASILAKVARDEYIDDLCKEHPSLIEHYSLNTNKGYGAKKHLDGIQQYGITEWHRKSFGSCRGAKPP